MLETFGVPFGLKAGMIGRLELKMNLLKGAIKFFSNNDNQNINIKLSDVYFIFGAPMKNNSHNDSFIEETEEEMLEPYDDKNCFNIFTNNLKLRKKRKPQAGKWKALILLQQSKLHPSSLSRKKSETSFKAWRSQSSVCTSATKTTTSVHRAPTRSDL